MAQHWGLGIIETRGELRMPKLEKAMSKALSHLSYTQTYADKKPPEDEVPPDKRDKKKGEPEPERLAAVELLDNGDGVLAIRTDEEKVVRDLARLVSEETKVPLLVMVTVASLFHRRRVQVECRKFAVDGSEIEEQDVMGHHDADISDLEHNELRQQDNAMRSRLGDVVDSFSRAEGTQGFKVKKVFRFKREVAKPKFSNKRLARLMTQIERCESFEVVVEGEQHIVKLYLQGATSLSYVKADEVAELEKALEDRPELQRRRKDD